jgi:diguanylate cyclase (GGDEF)-like protein/PAS domain S-box-containing protein
VLAAAYFAGPAAGLHTRPVFDLIAVSAVAALGVAAWTHRAGRAAALAWGFMAVALGAFVTADVAARTAPSIGDGLRLATYALLIAGLAVFVRARAPARDCAPLIDALVIATSAGAVSCVFLVGPSAHAAGAGFEAKATAVAFPLLDLALLAAVVRLAIGPGRRRLPSFELLATGFAALLLADSVQRWLHLHGDGGSGKSFDLGWIALCALVGAAALHPSARDLIAPAESNPVRLTPARLVVLAGCVCTIPIVLVFARSRADVSMIAVCAVVSILLICVRLFDLGRRHDSALLRAAVLAEAGAGLIEARSVSQVAEIARTAGTTLLGGEATVEIDAHRSAPAVASAFPLAGRREDHGVLSVDTNRRLDANRIEGLRALANSVALALDNVNVSDQLLRKRTELRFQALVQHASDAIIVLDAAGAIEYASPSTRRVLECRPRELVGRRFLDLVGEHDRARFAMVLAAEPGAEGAQACEFEFATDSGRLELEATATNLLDNDEVRGIVLNLRNIGERKGFERALAHQAFHDELTGLANRVLFRDRVEHALARVERGASMAVLFLDLDDFKTVNDTLGHQAGDELIKVVAARLTANARTTDTPARLGGDEFAVLIEDDDGNTAEIAQRLLEHIAAPIHIDGRELAMTASIGIAIARPGDGLHVDDLLRNADVAMYAAKTAGKGTCRSFARTMHTALLDRLELKRELQKALERREFDLHYQPIVDLETREIASLEALIRWNHPTRGSVAPDQFIPIAEETGAIVSIGRWALDTACRKAARIHQLLGPSAPTIAVNLSGRQLQEPTLVDDTLRILMATGLPPEHLVLEITETVMISDFELALNRLSELRRYKIRVAVDDFGSGYSSLNYIRRLPIDVLKIDREFLADINESREVAALAHTILDLARVLGVTAVAEGIEYESQLEILQQLGCRLGQGFLFMRPLPGDQIEREVVERAVARRAELIAS